MKIKTIIYKYKIINNLKDNNNKKQTLMFCLFLISI